MMIIAQRNTEVQRFWFPCHPDDLPALAGIPQRQAVKINTNSSIKEAVEWILNNSK